MGEFLLSNKIKMLNKYSNIDKFYGPYYIGEDDPFGGKYGRFSTIGDLEEALGDIADVGLTVGIISLDGTVLEYWFVKNSEEVLKLDIKRNGTKLTGVSISCSSRVDDFGSNIVEISYQATGSSLFFNNAVTLKENGRIKGTLNFSTDPEKCKFTLNNVANGSYIYTIEITDVYSQTVSVTSDEIIIGKAEIIPDLSNIESLSVINTTNIIGRSFSVKINILDPTWDNAVCSLVTEENIIIKSLDKGENIIDIDDSLIDSIDGHSIYALVSNNSDEFPIKILLFTVLSASILTVELNLIILRPFYPGILLNISLKFKSGASQMYIEADESSDFSFTPTTLTFNNFGQAQVSLTVTPKALKDKALLIIKYLSKTTLPLLLGLILNIPDVKREKQWEENLPGSNDTLQSCYIDFYGVITPDYTTKEGVLIKFNNYMYITNDVIHIGSLEVATPLNTKVYVGLGYNLSDTNPNTNKSTNYNCICINGVIVKITKLNENVSVNDVLWNNHSDYRDFTKNIKFEKNPENKECNGYYRINKLILDDNRLLCESNYYLDLNISLESNLIPLLFLEASFSITDPPKLKKTFYPSRFGSINDGFEKYASLAKAVEAYNNNLFKILKESTSLKSDLLKYYGVTCKYLYDPSGTINPSDVTFTGQNSGIVTVYTLGTSTLDYPIPNFKFYFLFPFDINVKTGLRDDNNIPIEYTYSDSVLTAKADYMESSHLNNTPTALLFNRIVSDESIVTEVSPGIQNNRALNLHKYTDAIVGSPIKLWIKDIDSPNYENYGSFMLNTDKTSDELGFGLEDGCISLEGTSNASEGSSARFLLSEINDSSLNISNLVEKDELNLSEINAIIKYLSRGFEYRYPDGNLDETMDMEHFNLFYNLWKFVATVDIESLDENGLNDIKALFKLKFSIEYCYIYIIFMLVFAQTDNLGKNCMFDVWKSGDKWGKWFPRPYDLDSLCGLNNGGFENIPPFVQISEKWLPKNLEQSGRDFINNYTTDENNESSSESEEFGYSSTKGFNYKYIKARKIFGYASSDSKLWETIYNLFRDEIELKYRNLRTTYLDYDNLINHYKTIIIDTIPVSLYNIDFLNKYLATPKLEFMLGNRWTNFLDWLKARIAFCDSFFKYKSVKYNLGRNHNLSLNYKFPAYLLYEYEGRSSMCFGNDITTIIGPAGGGGSATSQIYLSDSIVLNTSLYSDSAFEGATGGDNFEFESLQRLELGGSITPDLNKCKDLSELVIKSGFTMTSITIPKGVKSFICYSNSVDIINFLEGCLLENFSLYNHKNSIALNFKNCNYLKKVLISKSTISSLQIENALLQSFTSVENIFTDITITNSDVPTIDLSNLTLNTLTLSGNINRLDLFKTKFILHNLDISNIRGLLTLNLIKSEGIEKIVIDDNFKNLSPLKLGILDSDIKYFCKNSDSIIDLTLFPSTITSIVNYYNHTSPITPITVIESMSYNSNNSYYVNDKKIEFSGVSFANTKITSVKLPNKSILGIAIFANCTELSSITGGGNNCRINSDWAFFNCKSLNLSNSSSSNIFKLTKFKGTFVGTKVNYNIAENLIDNTVSTSADFLFFYCKVSTSETDITIDTTKYPNIKNLTYMFCQYNENNIFSTVTGGTKFSITVLGQFSGSFDSIVRVFRDCRNITFANNSNTCFNSSLQIINALETFYNCGTLNFDVNNFLSSLPDLTTTKGMFYGNTIKCNSLNPLNCSGLASAEGMFSNVKFLDSDNLNVTIIADNIFENITSDTLHLECCFYNSNFVQIQLKFEVGSRKVYILGLFGRSAISNLDTGTLIISFNESKFELSLNDYYTGSLNQTSNNDNKIGVFSYRKVSNNSISLSNKVDYRHFLEGISPSGSISVSIDDVNNISYICSDALNINLLIVDNIILALNAFRRCIFSNNTFSDTVFKLTNLVNAYGMFLGSSITEINFTLPNTVREVVDMFKACKGLKNGLPNNFFNSSITDVSGMFTRTLISVRTGGEKTILIPNTVTKAIGTFAQTHVGNKSAESILIDFSSNISDITGIFASSDIPYNKIDLANLFTANTNDNINSGFAFVNYSSIPNISYSKISDAKGMFYLELSNDNPWTEPDNLKSTTIIDGMFYNWSLASEKYKKAISFTENLYPYYVKINTSWP